MSNHGYVTSRKHLSPERVRKVFGVLNERIFRNRLRVDYNYSPEPDTSAWGQHVWELTIPRSPGEPPYAQRICWLASRRKFEIRHGGTDFAWWLGSAVINEIALAFDGTISDDGVTERWKGEPNKYDKFTEYADAMIARSLVHANEAEREFLRSLRHHDAPPEFLQ
jgi:hypothetical protein